MSDLDVPLFVVALFSSLATLVLQVALRLKLRARRACSQRSPAISILKPLKGADADLEASLVAFAEQRYQEFEILLGVADPADPVMASARRFRASHPGVAIRIVTGAPDIGMNPKVSNLAHMARHARHDVLLVSDADVRPGPEYLASMAAELDDDVGLVHSVLCSTAAERTGAILDGLHLNGWIAPVVAAGDRVGHACVIGKSMLVRRDRFETVGGWAAIKDVLAEDYVLGRRFEKLGLRVVQSPYVVASLNPQRTFGEFWARHVRWAQMRFRVCSSAYVSELAGSPLLWWTVWAVVASAPAARTRTAWALVAVAIHYLSQASLARRLHPLAFRAWHLLLMPVKDVLMLAIWITGIARREVEWRGVRMRIARGSRLAPISEPGLPLPDAVPSTEWGP